jgi:hypothetical protein
MGNSKSALTPDLMENNHIEALISELKDVRDRESEILVELEDILRGRIGSPTRTPATRKTSTPNPVNARVPVRDRASSNRTFFGKATTDKTPQVLHTVNGIARGDRVYLLTKTAKPADWPANRKFDPAASRHGIVTNIASDKISIFTDSKIDTWRAPHNVQRITK